MAIWPDRIHDSDHWHVRGPETTICQENNPKRDQFCNETWYASQYLSCWKSKTIISCIQDDGRCINDLFSALHYRCLSLSEKCVYPMNHQGLIYQHDQGSPTAYTIFLVHASVYKCCSATLLV